MSNLLGRIQQWENTYFRAKHEKFNKVRRNCFPFSRFYTKNDNLYAFSLFSIFRCPLSFPTLNTPLLSRQLSQDYFAYILNKDLPFAFFNLPCLQSQEGIVSRTKLAERYKIGNFWGVENKNQTNL